MLIVKRIIPIIIIVGLITAYFLYEKAKTTPNPYKIITSGYIEGHEVRLASLNGGRLLRLDVQEGDHAEAGQLLAEFETEQLEYKYAEMQASYDAAKSQYQKLVNGPRQDELDAAYQAYLAADSQYKRLLDGYRDEDIAPLRAELTGAESSLSKARSDFERMSFLYEQEVISKSQYESSQMAVDVAQSKYNALSDQIKQMEAGFPDEEIQGAKHQADSMLEKYQTLKQGAREEDIQSAEADLERIEAGIAQVNKQLSEAEVKSVTSGYIRDLPYRPGDVVPPGAPVATLVEAEELWVIIYAPAYRLASISLGQTGYLQPDALPGEQFEAKITYISPEGEFTPRNIQTREDRIEQVFKIKLTLTKNDPRLKPGMGCEVVIPLDGKQA